MTEQEISDINLLYDNMPHLIEDTAGQEHYIKIGGHLDERDLEFLFVFPQKHFHELLQLGLEAYKAKHGDPEPSQRWAAINEIWEAYKRGEATMKRKGNEIIFSMKEAKQ